MKRVFWTFLFLLFPSTIFAETLAVLLCQTEEGLIKYSIKEAMQDSLIGVAGKLTDYEIMTKENVMVILEKKGVDPNSCGDYTCAVDYGRKLTADKVITCNIVKTEEGCRMYLKLHDTHTAKMINSVEDSSSCSESKLLNLITSLGEKLLRGEIKGKGEGILELRTTQEMVDFSIDDGEITGRVTGSTIIRLEPGKHKIEFKKEGYIPYEEEVFIKKEEPVTVEALLSPVLPKKEKTAGTGILYINTRPEGATVFIDGKEYREEGTGIPGKTPLSIKDLPAGTHTIILKKPDYQPSITQVVVNAGAITRAEITLKENFGSLFIDTEPTGAFIYIDGINKGRTPYTQERIEAKSFKIKLVKENYHDLEEIVSINAGQKYSKTYKLSPAFGSLKVKGINGAEVYIDEKKEGNIPFEKKILSPGIHRIKVVKEFYKPYEKEVKIIEGEITEIEAVMEENFAFLSIETSPPDIEVFIDGKKIGKGKVDNVKVEAGEHVIEAGDPEYYKVFKKKIALNPKEKRKIKAEAIPRLGKLIVLSKPPEGTLFIDGKMVGKTPYEIEVLRGEHFIKVTKEGYFEGSDKVFVEEGDVKTVEITIKKYQPAVINIDTIPGDAEIYINGERKNKERIEVEPYKAIDILAKKKGYYDAKEFILGLFPGERKNILLELEKKPTWFQKKPKGFYITGNFGGLSSVVDWGVEGEGEPDRPFVGGPSGIMLGGGIGWYIYPSSISSIIGCDISIVYNKIQFSDKDLNMFYFPINMVLGIDEFSLYGGISFGYQWIEDSSGGQVHGEFGIISLIKNHFLLKIGTSFGEHSISYGLNFGVVL
jgi:hypothetical protein